MADLSPALQAYIPRFVQIESGGNPNARTGSYSGLLQMGPDEIAKYGGNGLAQGTQMLGDRAAQLSNVLGRDPSPTELYLAHQQGMGGAQAHMSNPDGLAWQNMAGTAEGRQKGAGWAKQAIWGNVPDDRKANYPGGVDSLTSQQFMDLWKSKVERTPQERNAMASAFSSDAPQTTQLTPARRQATPGALSAANVAGSGGLFGLGSGDAANPNLYDRATSDNGLNGIERAGVYLMGISNPAALGALKGIGNQPGRYATSVDPQTGARVTVDTQTGQSWASPAIPGFKGPAVLGADKKTADDAAEADKLLREGSAASASALVPLKRARAALDNEDIYFGAGGSKIHETRKVGAATGVKEYPSQAAAEQFNSDALAGLGAVKQQEGINRLTQSELFKIVQPGSYGFDISREGNRSIVDNRLREHQYNVDLNKLADQYRDRETGRLDPRFTATIAPQFGKQEQARWAAEDAARAKAAPAAAKPTPGALPKGVRSIQLVE